MGTKVSQEKALVPTVVPKKGTQEEFGNMPPPTPLGKACKALIKELDQLKEAQELVEARKADVLDAMKDEKRRLLKLVHDGRTFDFQVVIGGVKLKVHEEKR